MWASIANVSFALTPGCCRIAACISACWPTRHAPRRPGAWRVGQHTTRGPVHRGALAWRAAVHGGRSMERWACRQLVKAHSPRAMVELVVQVQRRVDQCQMGERLREVALLATGEPDLLGEQAHMVGIGRHLLKGEARLLKTAR